MKTKKFEVKYSCAGYFTCIVKAEKKEDVENEFYNGNFDDILDESQNFEIESIKELKK